MSYFLTEDTIQSPHRSSFSLLFFSLWSGGGQVVARLLSSALAQPRFQEQYLNCQGIQ